MFTNSLFSDFLKENGLKIRGKKLKDGTIKNETTRDIICLEFTFGTCSFEKQIKRIRDAAKKARIEYKAAKSIGRQHVIESKINKRKKITELYFDAIKNKDKYQEYSKEKVREICYENGIDIEYLTKNKKGEIIKREIIHYKMLYRSTGKAKKGSCMFICDRLYKKAQKFLYMGIRLPKKNAPIVEISAYAPLVSSAIVGRVKINPRNILILKDVDRFFETNVVSIETDIDRHCFSKNIDNYKLRNTLFDGQALIDSSIFPDYGNGYILLRHHFCKMAAFCTHIQKFFKDYFEDAYDTATVTDMFGIQHCVKDIELVTTDNAMKWLKFDKSYDYWCKKVEENGCNFGVVKTAHESKLGNVQRMSYQMINSLDINIMDNVSEESLKYINKLKTDDEFFLEYLEKNKNFSNDYEVLIALCEHNTKFVRSDYFRNRKRKIIEAYTLNMKSGRIIQDAENLVIVGSPYAMLLYAATADESSVDNDTTFSIEKNTIQCFTSRFNDDEYLAFFRSPFNSKNNLTYLHNTYHENFQKYFEFSPQIIAVNMNGTDFQDRNNGSDQDSDSGYTTNQKDIVEHAKKCYLNYHTIVNNIPKDKNVYNNTMLDFAKMDNTLSASQTDIGESSNLAQIAQTYSCNFNDPKFQNYTCILSVLAQVAIDNAKRRFDIDLTDEIKRIKKDMDIDKYKYPVFWSIIKKDFNKKNINKNLQCPMNCLYDIKAKEFKPNTSTLSFSDFFVKHPPKKDRRSSIKIEEMINKYSIKLYKSLDSDVDNDSEYFILRNDFNEIVDSIRKSSVSKNYLSLFSWLIDRTFLVTPQTIGKNHRIRSKINKNKAILLKILYDVNKENLLNCFKK